MRARAKIEGGSKRHLTMGGPKEREHTTGGTVGGSKRHLAMGGPKVREHTTGGGVKNRGHTCARGPRKRGRVKALPDDGRAKGVSKQRAKQNYVAVHARARSKRGRVKAPPIEKRGHERGQTQRRAEQKQWRNMRAPKEDRTDQSDT